LTTSPVTYGEYLKIPQLLALQQCRSRPAEHDELLFLLVHQAFELWFKLILHELDDAVRLMDRGEEEDVWEAVRRLERVQAVQRLFVPQIHVLETMTPLDFYRFRDHLKPASGFQSVQFREVEFLCGLKNERLLELCGGSDDERARLRRRFEGPTLGDAFYGLLRRHGFDVGGDATRTRRELLRLYRAAADHRALHTLAERLLDLDEWLQLWRTHHVRMVERMIGEKAGTGASVNQGLEGARYLRATLDKKALPDLWEMRTELEVEEA